MVTRYQRGIFKSKIYTSSHCLSAALVQDLEPCSVKDALLDPKWLAAMQDEFAALANSHNWDLVPNSSDMNLIGWVFRVKYKSDGSVLKYKACLVAKGFNQTPGIDFSETFSPVIKATTIEVIFSLPVFLDWDIQ